MDNLRLILLLLGLLILAAMVLLHRPEGKKQRNHARWLNTRREPSLGEPETQAPGPSDENNSESPCSASNLAAGLASARMASDYASRPEPQETEEQEVASPRGRRQAAPDKIVSLLVLRSTGRRISGTELHDAARKAGLDFGEMNIFHRLQEGASEPVFSMANLTAPGYFDPEQWSSFDTPGLTFFMTLPAPISALDGWDAMLATATRMAELLDAEVLDDQRSPVGRQRIAQMRDEMRDYDRKRGPGRGL